MDSPTTRIPAAANRPPTDLTLTNWPLRDSPVAALTTVAVMVGIGVVAAVLSESQLMGACASLALGLSMWKMWVRIEFHFGPKGIVLTFLRRERRISWSDVRRGQVLPGGILLSFDTDPPPVAAMRGLFIRWGSRREEVLAVVHYYLGSRAEI